MDDAEGQLAGMADKAQSSLDSAVAAAQAKAATLNPADIAATMSASV